MPKNGLSAIFRPPYSKLSKKLWFLAKILIFGVKLQKKWEFSQIQTNIQWIGPKKYYNFGEFEKNWWTSFLRDLGNVFFQNWTKFTKSAPEPNINTNKIWKYKKINWKMIETCLHTYKYLIKQVSITKSLSSAR